MKSRRVAAMAAVALALESVGVGAAVIDAEAPPQQTRMNLRDLPRVPGRPTSALRTGETKEQHRQGLLRERRVRDIRAETQGKPIKLGNKTVQLPPDTYVEGVVTHVMCGGTPAQCETPFYNIRRGRSLINVTVHSGRILSDHPATGEEQAFEFLKRALR